MDCLFLVLTAFACNGSVANIVAVETTVPLDGLGQRVSFLLRRFNGVTHCGCAQYAAARGHDFTGCIKRSTGMEHFAFQLGGCVQTVDYCAFGIIARVAASSQDNAQAWTRVPLCFNLVQRLSQCGFDQQYQARLQA